MPFTLYYTQETLEEIERTIWFYGERLRDTQWRSETSRIARNNQDISGFERRFHRLNAESPMNLDLFLSQFEQMSTLLDDKGFVLFDGDISLNKEHQYDMLLAYEEYLDKHRKERPKGQDAVKHDVVLLQIVQTARTKIGYGLDAGTFLITVDNHLASFERKTQRQKNGVLATIFPNQMFQLLRPFIATSVDVDKQFVESFSLPEFRIANEGFSETVSNVLKIMNSYPDVSEKLASEILSNKIVMEQFKDIGENTKETERFSRVKSPVKMNVLQK